MIILKDIKKSFSQLEVLKGINLTIEDSQIVSIVGASGAGKTTLLQIAGTLLKADSGKILKDGISFSAVFQEDRLLEDLDSVTNVLAVSPDLTEKAVKEALSEVLSEGDLDKPVKELSGGQKRRVAVVRALMHDSSCLILDEPFTGMDPDTIDKVRTFISKHAGKRIVLLVSHENINENHLIKVAL